MRKLAVFESIAWQREGSEIHVMIYTASHARVIIDVDVCFASNHTEREVLRKAKAAEMSAQDCEMIAHDRDAFATLYYSTRCGREKVEAKRPGGMCAVKLQLNRVYLLRARFLLHRVRVVI